MGIIVKQDRLRKLSANIDNGVKLSDEDKCFLANALNKIADGEDANLALDVKAKRGERKGLYAKNTKILNQHINGWISVANKPKEDGGLGKTIKESAALIHGKLGNISSAETLITNWHKAEHNIEEFYKIKLI